MARMVGKVKRMWYGQCKRGCCDIPISKTTVNRNEIRQAFKDAEEEMDDDGD